MFLSPRRTIAGALAVAALAAALAPVAEAADAAGGPPATPEGIDFFERKIRPVLVASCQGCHSAAAGMAEGNLLLDTRAAMRRGGSRGAAIVPGQPDKSLLLAAIRHDDQDLAMPPEDAAPLPAAVVEDFAKWIAMGAPDPREGDSKPPPRFDLAQVRREHWAFRPLVSPPVPVVADAPWNAAPIDAFIRAAQESRGVVPAPEAEPLIWLRRVHLDLVGLPPTPSEQAAFAGDHSPTARERVVDDLLSRPQYGERWGRHWLDVARYAETQGYEHDALRPHAWRYRDWVIDAFNRDLPYDRFVEHQLAGDEIEGSDAPSQIATSFLCVGPFDHVSNDGRKAEFDCYDDMVATTASAFLGLTVQCARCHDHKFEPISQADYYRLLAAFEPLKIDRGQDMAGPIRPVGTAADLEAAQRENERLDGEAAGPRGERDGLWREVLGRVAAKIAAAESAADGSAGNPPLPPKGFREAKPLEKVLEALAAEPAEREKKFKGLLDRERKKIDESVALEATAEERERLAGLAARLDAIDARRPVPIFANVFSERPDPPKTRILLRGEHTKPGDEVAFGPPEVLAGAAEIPAAAASGTTGRRLALARFITGPAAPLAARVMVSRVWQHHFGTGLVRDANDLGVAGGPPTHPELLDWLAADFVAGGWRLKRLHRVIVLSRTYGLSATPPAAAPADPELYAAWPLHRLDAEPIRDAILAASGELNLKAGGPSVHPPFDQKIVGNSARNDWKQSEPDEAARRSVYVFAKRAIPYPDLAILGLPESSASASRRAIATTSVQALLLLNGKFVARQAAMMAARLRREAGADVAAQVRLAFELALCRPPRAEEVEAARDFIGGGPRGGSGKADADDGLAAFCAILFNTSEFVYAN